MAEKSDSCIKNEKKKVAALHPIFRPRPQLNCETADSNPHKSQQKKQKKATKSENLHFNALHLFWQRQQATTKRRKADFSFREKGEEKDPPIAEAVQRFSFSLNKRFYSL